MISEVFLSGIEKWALSLLSSQPLLVAATIHKAPFKSFRPLIPLPQFFTMKYAATLVLLLASQSSAWAQSDPLQSFKDLVKRCQDAYSTTPSSAPTTSDVQYLDDMKVWVKRLRTEPKLSYDVRKTDSLVSPFVAELVIEQFIATESADSEAAVREKTVSPELSRAILTTRKINFSLQDGRWIAKSGHMSMSSRKPNEAMAPSFSDTLTEASIKAFKQPLATCAGQNP